MKEFPEIYAFGEQGILIDYPPGISGKLLGKLLCIKEFLRRELVGEQVEVTNTYASLLLYYQEGITDPGTEISRVRQLLARAEIGKQPKSEIFEIPVCYEEKFAPDMQLVANEKGLTKDQVIALHCEPLYKVYFIGFLPGFLYLGGLDSSLKISRKKTPRLRIPKGAVAIGEQQTGIYPSESPGGWQIIGNSPVPFFEPEKTPPVSIQPGDRIRFFPVAESEYIRIQKAIQQRNYMIKKLKYDG